MGNELTKVYVCSPYRVMGKAGKDAQKEQEENIRRAKKASRLLCKLGYFPLCPHLYFTQILDDGDVGERAVGLALGMEWLRGADECWCFGDRISEGMSQEIAFAKDLGIPVRMMPEPEELVREIIAHMKGEM